MVSLMLFCETVYMSIVIVLVKLFGRKPDKRYKFEPLRDDVESENSDYPHVLIQIPMFNEKEAYKLSIGVACGLSWPTDRLVIQVLDDSTDPTIKDYKDNEISRTSSKFLKQKENHQEPSTLEQEMSEKSENNIVTSLTESHDCCWSCGANKRTR